MTDSDLVAGAIGELYGSPAESFVALRTAWVKRARAVKDKEAAGAIAGLRKPTRSAEVLNHLARGEPAAIQDLLHLGADLRRAQRTADAPLLRELTARRRALVADLVRLATGIAGELSPGVREEIVETLGAALVDDAVAAGLQSGTLSTSGSWDGFGPEVSVRLSVVPDRADSGADSGTGTGTAESTESAPTPVASAGSAPTPVGSAGSAQTPVGSAGSDTAPQDTARPVVAPPTLSLVPTAPTDRAPDTDETGTPTLDPGPHTLNSGGFGALPARGPHDNPAAERPGPAARASGPDASDDDAADPDAADAGAADAGTAGTRAAGAAQLADDEETVAPTHPTVTSVPDAGPDGSASAGLDPWDEDPEPSDRELKDRARGLARQQVREEEHERRAAAQAELVALEERRAAQRAERAEQHRSEARRRLDQATAAHRLAVDGLTELDAELDRMTQRLADLQQDRDDQAELAVRAERAVDRARAELDRLTPEPPAGG